MWKAKGLKSSFFTVLRCDSCPFNFKQTPQLIMLLSRLGSLCARQRHPWLPLSTALPCACPPGSQEFPLSCSSTPPCLGSVSARLQSEDGVWRSLWQHSPCSQTLSWTLCGCRTALGWLDGRCLKGTLKQSQNIPCTPALLPKLCQHEKLQILFFII